MILGYFLNTRQNKQKDQCIHW